MTIIHGFELVREQDIPELSSKARLFRHVKTGAELLSLENDDENKVFGITFCTLPSDSTGVAHILEHAVLSGSRKYPLKEPFAELLKGSLQTFLNAFTFPDKTCYPVASQNQKDFYNLVDVYLDTVFHPLLRPYTFQEQGWHYELESPDDPLIYKGVVFNEMKGAYTSPDRVLAEYAQHSLFPGHTYGLESGGHPQHIPDLTYEQFKAFHQTYYHPSNARIFFYGDDHSDERLRLVNDYLKDFDGQNAGPNVALQTRFEQPQRFVHPYAVGEDDPRPKGMVTVNWLLDEATEPETALALHILAHILIGTPASPLRKALIDSGLGEDLAGIGLESELRQMFFSTGLKGISLDDADKIEALILQTLADLVQNGLDPQTVEASLNTIEFRLRENNTGRFPRGLVLMLRSLTTWLYGGDPLAPLAFEAPLATIKSRLAADGAYFESLLRRYFLENLHRTTLILEPDPELNRREEAQEKARLAQARQAMSPANLQAVIEGTRALRQFQEAPDPPEVLAAVPRLQLADLDRQNRTIPLAVFERSGTKILYHDLFTNGILYLDVGFNLHALSQECLPYIPLFGRALLETGTETEDFVSLSQRIGRQTGGLRPETLTSAARESDRGAAWLFLRGKATPDRANDLLDILRDVLLTARLDNQERFRQIVLEEKAQQEARLAPMGHLVVKTRLSARFNEADWAAEQMGGVSYLFFLRELAQLIEADWPAVLETLERIRQDLLKRQAAMCNVTLDEGNWTQLEPQLAAFLEAIPASSGALEAVPWSPQRNAAFEGLAMSAPVNYVGKGANLYEFGYQLRGSAAVVTRYLRSTWLWEQVRVQGGAYGGFCLFDYRSGVFSYLSYRDPNLLQTLAAYDRTSRYLRQLSLTDDELTKAIIGAISDMDAYQLPDAKGYTSLARYLVGDSDEFRQRLRDEVLSTTVADFKAFADVLEQAKEQGQVVVLGSPAAIEAANAERKDWLKVTRVL
ncbi:MAG: insulinase family protein [Anaerolineae bacterium]